MIKREIAPLVLKLARDYPALATRMERAKLNPVKDKERAQLIAPYLAKLKSLREHPAKTTELHRRSEEFRWCKRRLKSAAGGARKVLHLPGKEDCFFRVSSSC